MFRKGIKKKHESFGYSWKLLGSFCKTVQNYDNCYRFNDFERWCNILWPYKYVFLNVLKISIANICNFHLHYVFYFSYQLTIVYELQTFPFHFSSYKLLEEGWARYNKQLWYRVAIKLFSQKQPDSNLNFCA